MADYCLYCMTKLGENGVCPSGGEQHKVIASEPHHIKPGTVLAEKYLLGRVLGEGGFGITYIALDRKTGSKCVIKEYYPKSISSRISGSNVISFSGSRSNAVIYEKGKMEFLRVAKTVKQTQMPACITGVCDHFESNNTIYSVSGFVSGDTLTKTVEARGKMKPEDLFRLIGPIFNAVDDIHSKGILHHDISPDNIIIENGKAKLTDLGIARDQTNIGTDPDSEARHFCASPEHYSDTPQGAGSDSYELAATVYYCLTGYKPERAPKRLQAECLTPPTRFGARISPQQEEILMKALSLEPTNRYISSVEFRSEFLAAAAKPPAPPAHPQVSAAPVRAPGSENKKKFIIGGIAAVLVVGLIAVLVATSGGGTKIDTHAADSTTASTTGAPAETSVTVSETTAPPITTTSVYTEDTTAPADTDDPDDESSGEEENEPEETSTTQRYVPPTTTAATTKAQVSSEFTVERGILTKYNGSGGSITIPSNVTAIGDRAFEGYKSITAVTIPENVMNIGSYAFSNCSNLKQISLGEGVINIGDYAFNNCTSLAKITIPSKVAAVSPTVFSGCSSMTEINVRRGNAYLTAADGVLFNSSKTTLISYPRNKSDAYYDVPSSVTKIESYAFTGCKNLKEVTLSNGLKTIGDYSFYKCTSLKTMKLEGSVSSIGKSAFSKCTNLSSVVVGVNIKSIGENAFEGCDSLSVIRYKGSVSGWDNVKHGEYGKKLDVICG